MEIIEKLYKAKEEEIGDEQMRELERMILIRVVDTKWMDHIDAMEQLKSGIGLRGIGQQDPAAAYAQEGFDMFEEMIGSIKEDTVTYCFNVTVETRAERKKVIGKGQEHKDEVISDYSEIESDYGQPGEIPDREVVQETVRREGPKVGRNDPCPCGSGKKYKHCCGKH